MNRIAVLVLVVPVYVFANACGGAASTNNTANTANVARNANVAAMNSNANEPKLSAEEKIKQIQAEANAKRDQVLSNAQNTGNQSLANARAEAENRNEELKRKIEESKNANR